MQSKEDVENNKLKVECRKQEGQSGSKRFRAMRKGNTVNVSHPPSSLT